MWARGWEETKKCALESEVGIGVAVLALPPPLALVTNPALP